MWLKGKNSRGISYCINTDSIRNITIECGTYRIWFNGVAVYQEITKEDYEKLISYIKCNEGTL